MRYAVIILSAAVLVALAVSAQTANAPGAQSGPALRAPLADQQEKVRLPPLGPPRAAPPGAVTYGGALVSAARAEKPLHLLNPLAPAEYGDGTQHLRRDPHTGQGRGVSLFSIHFDLRPKAGNKKTAADDPGAKPKKAKAAGKAREKQRRE